MAQSAQLEPEHRLGRSGRSIEDVSDLLDAATAARSRLSLIDIDALAPSGASGRHVAFARLYGAMLADTPADGLMEAACIRAVVASTQWPSLLVEMLTNLPFTPAVARTIVGILAARLPEHPAARYVGGTHLAIVKAYDAVDDGVRLRLDLGPADDIGNARVGCLLSIEEPALSFAGCAIVERAGDTIWLTAERDGPLFAERRYVLPPAVLITAEG